MNEDRRRERRDRKTSRAQKKADKKVARAGEAESAEPRPNRLAKLVRVRPEEIAAARARLVADESAFLAEDLGVARSLLIALDALLDSRRAAAVERVREAAALLEAEAERETPSIARLTAPAPALVAAAPAAPADAPTETRPVLVPSFLRADGGTPRMGPTPLAVPAGPPPAGNIAPPAAAPAFVAPPAVVASPPPVVAPAAVAPPVSDAVGLDETTAAPATAAPSTLARKAGPKTLTDTAVPFAAQPSSKGGLPFAPTAGASADPLTRFPLGVYASACAELQARPQFAESILHRYGLTDPALREAVDRGHKERLAKDPALRIQFDEMLARAHASLRGAR